MYKNFGIEANAVINDLCSTLEAKSNELEELRAEIRAKDSQFRLCAAHGGNAVEPAPQYCPKCLESQMAGLQADYRNACQQNIKAQDIERNYSHQLGEMARLSDIVCTWVLQHANVGEESAEVEAAASEIMAYVDAVRPTDGEKETTWTMHIIGPDDVIPCAGEFDALRKANQHNRSMAKMFANMPPDGFSPNDPYCVAVAESV